MIVDVVVVLVVVVVEVVVVVVLVVAVVEVVVAVVLVVVVVAVVLVVAVVEVVVAVARVRDTEVIVDDGSLFTQPHTNTTTIKKIDILIYKTPQFIYLFPKILSTTSLTFSLLLWCSLRKLTVNSAQFALHSPHILAPEIQSSYIFFNFWSSSIK